ncbi:LysR family transcriptional regulator [Pseudomonas sp. NPDC087342]|uniref:LysR family transcriptional regulator n=1 Tax=Pseudomonas sp. NPDC087342 TaxID=3364437 RepID=UPI0037FFDDE8
MDINQLRTLIQVAELGSLSKAADRLCTAQPALSRRMAMLEDELDAKLFERHGRGMIITAQGQRVLQHARRIMAEMDEIKSSLADEALRGHVSIGLLSSVTDVLTVPLIEAIRTSHPYATCRIVSGYSLDLLERVHSGDLDVAVLYDPLSIRSLKSTPFLEEDLYIVGSKAQNFSYKNPLDFSSLSQFDILLPSARHSTRQIADEAAHMCGIHLNVKIDVDSFSVLKQLVINDNGVSIIPITSVRQEIAEGKMTAAPLINPTPLRRLELSYPADRPISRLATYVGQRIIATSSDLIDQGIWTGARVIE